MNNKLGEGAFGCVVKTNRACPTTKPNSNYVSKLLTKTGMKTLESELKAALLIQQIDPKNTHFISLIDHCSIDTDTKSLPKESLLRLNTYLSFSCKTSLFFFCGRKLAFVFSL